MVYLDRTNPFKFFKGCLPQILLGPFLNTWTQLLKAKDRQSWVKILEILKSSRSQMLLKIGVFENRLQACNFIKKVTLAQVFSSEFYEIFKNTLFIKHLWWLLLKACKSFSLFYSIKYRNFTEVPGVWILWKSTVFVAIQAFLQSFHTRKLVAILLFYAVFYNMQSWLVAKNKKGSKLSYIKWKESFYYKGPQACNFTKKRLQHRCFPVKYAKFLRALHFTEKFYWLLLKSMDQSEVLNYFLGNTLGL